MLYSEKTIFQNKLKAGKGNDSGLYHETEERARLAAKGNERDYSVIAERHEFKSFRCDVCSNDGVHIPALPHASGKDLCQRHREQANRGAL